MSEIFNFLKKTETEQKRGPAYPMPGIDVKPVESAPSISKPVESMPEFENIQTVEHAAPVAPAPSVLREEEFLPADTFALTRATHQMKSVLDPMTMFGEQFRVLRTKLGLLQKQHGIKTILVSSTVPQEGKSFTACALAGVFAQEQGKRVVVIDADMRKTGSGKDFGLNGNNNIAGTAQVLQGGKDFRSSLMKSIDPEFWFLPSGSLPKNPSELLSSPALESMLKCAADNFDWVIVDAPPVLALSDPTLIAPLCDSVVFVVRANSTPSKLVQDAVNRIGRERICGVVLSRQKQMRTSRYYYQYYYQKSEAKKTRN
jgi:capsular exopolysaccharide synthesis family protein